MTRPIPKIKYYVKCGELEKWVIGHDPINAAAVALMNADGGTMLDPYHFHASKNYYPDIEKQEADWSGDILSVSTDEILELCNMEVTDDDDEIEWETYLDTPDDLI